ncbi:hypothetical protein VHA_002970 [Grimontia hollisae CIP 101886]|uniref:Uncharacterized protein n=1 Tax=Grimontia hollisae CIP 101886 TaxID=675812 RepID=D0IB43_GRIHO|nr:hypothetical protein VHA_002970 [Grimontia hollisae CIP 101886]
MFFLYIEFTPALSALQVLGRFAGVLIFQSGPVLRFILMGLNGR